MQGVLHRIHGRPRTAGFNPFSTLITAAALIATVLAMLIMLLGVFVTRAT